MALARWVLPQPGGTPQEQSAWRLHAKVEEEFEVGYTMSSCSCWSRADILPRLEYRSAGRGDGWTSAALEEEGPSSGSWVR